MRMKYCRPMVILHSIVRQSLQLEMLSENMTVNIFCVAEDLLLIAIFLLKWKGNQLPIPPDLGSSRYFKKSTPFIYLHLAHRLLGDQSIRCAGCCFYCLSMHKRPSQSSPSASCTTSHDSISVGQATSEVSLFEPLTEVALNYNLVIYSRPTVVVPVTHVFV